MSFRALFKGSKTTGVTSTPSSPPDSAQNSRRVTIAESPTRPPLTGVYSSSSNAVSTTSIEPGLNQPIEKFYPIYKPKTLTQSIELCCERIKTLVKRFEETHVVLKDLKPRLDPELERLEELFRRFSPLWNEQERTVSWSSDVQGNLVISLLTLQFRVSEFERTIFDMLFNDLNAQGSLKPDPQKLDKLSKFAKDFGAWCANVDRLVQNPEQRQVGPEFVVNMQQAFGKTFLLMGYLVKSDVSSRVEERKNHDFAGDPDYRQIKYRMDDLENKPSKNSGNSDEIPVNVLTFKEPVRKRLPVSSDKNSAKSTLTTSGPVFVHRVDIGRKPANYERRVQEVRKLAVMLSQQNFCARFPRFYGCIESPDSDEKDSKTGENLRPDCMYFLSDATDTDTLAKLIENYNEEPISPSTLRKRMRIVAGIAEGLFFLHASKIVHKDVRPVNVIIHRDSVIDEDDFQPRLTGFTKSRQFDMASRPSNIDPVEVYWESPNYRGARYSYEDDIYKLGLIMCDVAVWKTLQNTEKVEEIGDDVRAAPEVIARLNSLKEEFAQETKSIMGDDYGELVLDCINTESNCRPNAWYVWQKLTELSNEMARPPDI